MKKEEIKKYLLENKGATLEVETLEPSQAKKGFMVSIYGTEEQETNINKVIEKIIKRAEQIKEKKQKNVFVGVWLFDGVWYIDTSRNIKSRKKAIYYGEKNKQIAIYNLENGEEIKLKYEKIKYYTMYRVIKNEQEEIINEIPIKQFDNIKEIEKELKMKSNCIYKDIKRHSLIDNKYYLYIDYMLKSEFDLIA